MVITSREVIKRASLRPSFPPVSITLSAVSGLSSKTRHIRPALAPSLLSKLGHQVESPCGRDREELRSGALAARSISAKTFRKSSDRIVAVKSVGESIPHEHEVASTLQSACGSWMLLQPGRTDTGPRVRFEKIDDMGRHVQRHAQPQSHDQHPYLIGSRRKFENSTLCLFKSRAKRHRPKKPHHGAITYNSFTGALEGPPILVNKARDVSRFSQRRDFLSPAV